MPQPEVAAWMAEHQQDVAFYLYLPSSWLTSSWPGPMPAPRPPAW